MAQYRMSVTIAQRSAGRKAVAMAAYRSGQDLHDRHHGERQDYSHRSGVVYSKIVLPADAPEWASDRATLWSQVEDREKSDKAQLAREIQLSLPHEMNDAQRAELTYEFARHIATEYGFAVDMNIHAPSREGDQRNHHAHLLLTTRAFDSDRADGWAKTKDRSFDDIAMKRSGQTNAVADLREVWETMENQALRRADIRDERGEFVQVDRRSYEERGLDIEPTIKLGPTATEMQRRGESSDRAGINDDIRERNADRREVAHLRDELEEIFESIGRTPLTFRFAGRRQEIEALTAELEEATHTRSTDRENRTLLGVATKRPELLDTDPDPDDDLHRTQSTYRHVPFSRSR